MKSSFYHGDSEINRVFGKGVIATKAMFFTTEENEDTEKGGFLGEDVIAITASFLTQRSLRNAEEKL